MDYEEEGEEEETFNMGLGDDDLLGDEPLEGNTHEDFGLDDEDPDSRYH